MAFRLLAVTFIMAVLNSAAHVKESFAEEKSFVRPGRYLVKFRNSSKRQKPKLVKDAKESGRKRPRRYHRAHDKCGAIRRLNKDVQECSADFLVRADADPFVSNCPNTLNCAWGIENISNTDINLPEAWAITEGSQDIVVAVLDTGIDLNHPDIKDNIWTNPNEIAGNNIDDDGNGWIDDIHGINAIDASTNVQDDNGHGTHVSGIISAVRNNDIGIAGVAPKVKIIPVKILDDEGNGFISSAIVGIDYIVDLAVNHNIPIFVFNNSWGAGITQTTFLLDAFENASDAGILATAAAGNGGSDGIGDNLNISPFLPAKLLVNNIIAVASIDFSGNLSVFSNFGNNFVHLAAPGGTIRSLLANGVTFGSGVNEGTVNASGTSMATPFVTGVLALMRAHLTALTPFEIRDRLLQRTVPLSPAHAPKVISGGRLDAYYALTGDDIPLPTPQPSFTPTNTATFTPTLSFTSTPLPTAQPVVPTSAPTFGSVPTVISIPESPKVSGSLKIAPVNLVNSTSADQSIIAAKKSNLIDARLSSPSPGESYKLSISNAACLIKEFSISENLLSTLKLKKAARKLKTLDFKLIDSSGGIVSERNVTISGGPKKGNGQLSCKSAKKNVLITAAGRSL